MRVGHIVLLMSDMNEDKNQRFYVQVWELLALGFSLLLVLLAVLLIIPETIENRTVLFWLGGIVAIAGLYLTAKRTTAIVEQVEEGRLDREQRASELQSQLQEVEKDRDQRVFEAQRRNFVEQYKTASEHIGAISLSTQLAGIFSLGKLGSIEDSNLGRECLLTLSALLVNVSNQKSKEMLESWPKESEIDSFEKHLVIKAPPEIDAILHAISDIRRSEIVDEHVSLFMTDLACWNILPFDIHFDQMIFGVCRVANLQIISWSLQSCIFRQFSGLKEEKPAITFSNCNLSRSRFGNIDLSEVSFEECCIDSVHIEIPDSDWFTKSSSLKKCFAHESRPPRFFIDGEKEINMPSGFVTLVNDDEWQKLFETYNFPSKNPSPD